MGAAISMWVYWYVGVLVECRHQWGRRKCLLEGCPQFRGVLIRGVPQSYEEQNPSLRVISNPEIKTHPPSPPRDLLGLVWRMSGGSSSIYLEAV